MKISISAFRGIAPKVEPRYLPDGAAQVAINVVAEGQSVRPLRGVLATATSVTMPASPTGSVPTIYKAGMETTTDSQYWLASQADLSICRTQIAGDTCEWTFFAEPNSPTQVTNKLGWASDPKGEPVPSYRLGIPAPEEPLTGWVNYVTPTTTQAVLTLDSADLAQFVTWNPYTYHPNGFHVSIDKGTNWFYPTTLAGMGTKANVSIMAGDLDKLDAQYELVVSIDGDNHTQTAKAASKSATDVAAALNAMQYQGRALVDATVTAGGVYVASKVAGQTATLTVSWIELPPSGATRKMTGLGTILSASDVLTALLGQVAHVGNATYVQTGGNYFTGELLPPGGPYTSLKLTSKDVCIGVGGPIPGITTSATCALQSGPPTWFAGEHAHLSVKWNDGYANSKTASGSSENKGSYESRVYVFTWIYRADADSPGCPWVWESAPSPPSAVANVFADSTVYVSRTDGTGTCSIPAYTTAQACVLGGGTWTPAPGTAQLPPAGYMVNGLRLYRSVEGQYLLVAEGNVTDTEYTDDKLAAELGEPCPSILWSHPPSRTTNGATKYLDGIINLPNGMVAGFLGRDVYFAEPYKPFAWPETYIQTVDDLIIGLGRMDTTLAVLTTGVPYFMQGSHPENMNVVKGDMEQACVSKRSIVSMGRSVFYASPDGLMALTPGGSGIITEGLFDREYWQKLVPANIHAYGHDGKYVAFFGSAAIPLTSPGGTTYQVGGFVLDTASKQFYLHGISCRAGYRDLRTDTLYLAIGSPSANIVKWGQGAPVASTQAIWRSKIFAMPQSTGFSCGQLEAGPLTVLRDGAARDAYPLTLRVYADGLLFWQQVVTSQAHYDTVSKLLMGQRAPFRLPPLVNTNGQFLGRDWEIELEVGSEIFNLVLAQSMSEIASA